jgi:NADH-quinone oxidoreductase subunit H
MDWIDTWLIPAIKAIILVVGLLAGYAYGTLAERKLCGRFQLRYGPNRAGPFGLLQPIADAVKMIFKEEMIPNHVDKILYVVAPALALIPALVMLGVVPFGTPIHLFGREISLQVIQGDLSVGLVYVLAVAAVGGYGVVLGGWASNNNYSLLGALRATAQMISYELPMGLSLVALVVVTGTLSMQGIVAYQSTLPLIILQPIGFLIFLICSFAEAGRGPFDLPETENELISGYSTEYGGIKFALYFMMEYVHLFVAAVLISTLFLGGWQGPLLPPIVWSIIKVCFLFFFFVWVRASLPRVRYDKLMKFCWKFLTPLALVNLIVTAVVVVALH